MTDIVDSKTRSRMMSGIKGKNTKPEILIRSLLHRNGFRFRIHEKNLPGKPDIVLKRYQAVIFVHGCFWHRHLCHLFKWPKTRPDFWRDKINKNVINDQKNIQALTSLGWRICIVWECSIKGIHKNIQVTTSKLEKWLKSEKQFMEITG
jgi:DNA mismatch endonuclease, patch repair protein